jgi:type I restriction enzyme M protein
MHKPKVGYQDHTFLNPHNLANSFDRAKGLGCEEKPGSGYDRDKASRDIFWLRDESLEHSDNHPDPDILVQEIVDDLKAALERFREIASDLNDESVKLKQT